jgi:hypothetical protein
MASTLARWWESQRHPLNLQPAVNSANLRGKAK